MDEQPESGRARGCAERVVEANSQKPVKRRDSNRNQTRTYDYGLVTSVERLVV